MTAKKTGSKKTARKARTPKFAGTGHERNYCQIAVKYAVDAVADKKGKTHCKWVRLAAKRFLDDLKRANRKKDKPFLFDPWHGNDVCDFIEKLPHIEGEWATPEITLEPAQIFILVNVFGFRKLSGGRRFTRVYIEMARKNAKSTLTAGIALYCLTCEDEIGPQIIIGATTGEQAQKVFNPARRMALKTPELCEAFALEVWAKSITCADNGGFIQTINAKGKTQDGWNPHLGILDELHAHTNRELYDVIRSAMGARKNPLMWTITTAGYNTLGVCFEQHLFIRKVLETVVDADHYFGIIFTLDEKDDPLDPKVWIKANPLLNVAVQLDELEAFATEAREMPETMGEFKTKRLNIWTTAKGAWLNMEHWKKCPATLVLRDLVELPAYAGLDLSATSDITAFVIVWMVDGRLKIWGRYYLPEETVMGSQRRNVPYQMWVDQGWLQLTPGATVDYDYMARDIQDALDKYDIGAIAYDKWNSTQLVNDLLEDEAPMVEFRQGPASYNQPMKEFERLLKSHRIDHDGNPVLAWALSNVVARKDVNENMAPDRKNSLEKIDPAAAGLMALGALLRMEDEVRVIDTEYEGVMTV